MITREFLLQKSSKDIRNLLNTYKASNKLPKYIDVQFILGKGATIDTDLWELVSPQFINNVYTGKWVSRGSAGLLNDDSVIMTILNHTGNFKESIIPANGGGIKYRKKMSRRYRYKNRKSLKSNK